MSAKTTLSVWMMFTAVTMLSEEVPLSGRAVPRVLIVGGDGSLAGCLARHAACCGVEVVNVTPPGEDLISQEGVDRLFALSGPVDCVINATMAPGLDQAEEQPDLAFALNRDSAALLAQACADRSLALVHLSSGYVFDGLKITPYLPADPVAPLSVFGRSQAEGETQIRKRLARHVIVRSTWLFGQEGSCFVKDVLRQAAEQEELRIADDQVGCPTYADDLAGALLKAALRAAGNDDVWGTYHFCNEGAVTWYAFARRIAALAAARTRLAVKRILPVLSVYKPYAALRPLCTILDCSSFDTVFGIERRPWPDALREMLAELFP